MMESIGHEKVRELLPWFVNGTVHGRERDQLERHLAGCLVCRGELKAQRALNRLVQEQPTVRWSAEQGFDRLVPRLDGRGPSRFGPWAWLSAWWGSARTPRRMSIRLGGAVAVAAALAVVVWVGVGGRGFDAADGFTTLTQGAETPGAVVDIVFTPGVSEAEMRALLQEIGGTIVAGPSAVGRYSVRIDQGGLSEAGRTALMELLLMDSRVRFAGWNFTRETAAGRE